MKKSNPSKFKIPCSKFFSSITSISEKQGFTLMEVILVLVVMLIISGIALPHFAGTFKGSQLRTSARTIERMSKYARSMAIMREETLTIALNHETMEIFLGGEPSVSENVADGELDQDVLKRLGYTDDDESDSQSGGIEKEVHRFLPDELTVRDFQKERTDEDDEYEDLYMIRFFPNGQCEGFKLELEDSKGMGIKIENDPISGKIRSEFVQ